MRNVLKRTPVTALDLGDLGQIGGERGAEAGEPVVDST